MVVKEYFQIQKALKRQKKRSKFYAIKCSHDGYKFDSIKEGDEYLKLRLRKEGGDIGDLRIHPKYPILINDIKVCTVILDFEYYDNIEKITYYIDVKGFDRKTRKFRVTAESKLKKKILEAHNGIIVNYI